MTLRSGRSAESRPIEAPRPAKVGASSGASSQAPGESGAGTVAGSSAPIGRYGQFGPGYGQAPAIEGARGWRLHAGAARRVHALEAAVAGMGSLIAHGLGEPGGGAGARLGGSEARPERSLSPSDAAVPAFSSSSRPLLGVGIPDADLLLLLLIPLIVIGLTILDVIARGARRGPLDGYFKHVVAPGYAPRRRRPHARGRR